MTLCSLKGLVKQKKEIKPLWRENELEFMCRIIQPPENRAVVNKKASKLFRYKMSVLFTHVLNIYI